MATIFASWLIVPMLAIGLDIAAERRDVAVGRTIFALALHLTAAVVLCLGALAWFNYSVIEDFDRGTDALVVIAKFASGAGALGLVVAWSIVWTARSTPTRTPRPDR